MTVLYMMKSVFIMGICQLIWQEWMQLQAGQTSFLCKPWRDVTKWAAICTQIMTYSIKP